MSTVTITQTDTPSRSKMAGPCWIAVGSTYASTRPREIDAAVGDVITVKAKLAVRRATRTEEIRKEWQLRVTGVETDTVELTATPYGQTVTAVLTGVSEDLSEPEPAAEALNLDIMTHDTPAPEASDITDITWDMMSGAGIDIGLVDEHPDGTCYVYQRAGLRIAFGPGTALAGEVAAGESAPKGWDVGVSQAHGDGEWFDSGQNWLPTAAAAVEYVALVISGR